MTLPAEHADSIRKFLVEKWDKECIPAIAEYIKIESQSPAYDAQWETNGLQDKAMAILVDWLKKQTVKGLSFELMAEKGKTPLLLVEIQPTGGSRTLLMYGHMDKQPPMTGWDADLGPYKPVIKDDKLYGRGGADDGYSIFTAITAIEALQRQNISHSRIVIMIEACEESGSDDLPFWMEKASSKIQTPDLIICLDSGALNYEQLWCTASLRGVLTANLKVSTLKEGVHSGMAGGLVPSSFLVIRQLLSRIEDEKTGKVLLPELHCEIPQQVQTQMKEIDSLGPDAMYRDLPLQPGAKPLPGSAFEQALANTWKPCISYIGVGGIPDVSKAGNVLRPETQLTLSVRLPPLVVPEVAFKAIKTALEKDPPFGAKVEVVDGGAGPGWAAPVMKQWLVDASQETSKQFFNNKPTGLMGVGGSIPFMGMLGQMYPKAQFFISGVLGPKSNAHGPNEFLHIGYVKAFTCCVAALIAAHDKSPEN
jgi:acetylornithine deacetylase/succinyl-diaminopimelate desuccinylase-like protein